MFRTQKSKCKRICKNVVVQEETMIASIYSTAFNTRSILNPVKENSTALYDL